jgi:arsenate reductase (glutaredoxin)
MITLYGIPNCDTVKKSRAWLDEHQLIYHFHDFKKPLVNKKGTTWRKLDAAQQSAVVDVATATALMLRHASVIKRPVVVNDAAPMGNSSIVLTTVGYSPEVWATWAEKPVKA